MPIYNGIEYIDESIKSILNQTFKEWELIIGINGHAKNSNVFKIANKYNGDKIKVYDMYDIKGKSNALNKMLNYVNYNWVALLDVDDIWLPKKLESQLPYLNEYDVIGTMCKYFGDLNIYPNIPNGDISNFNFIHVNPIINSSCLIRKDLCYWDSNWDGVEDYDLWLKLWTKQHKFYNVSSVQILHRIHNDSAFNANGNNLKVNDLRNKYIYYKINI